MYPSPLLPTPNLESNLILALFFGTNSFYDFFQFFDHLKYYLLTNWDKNSCFITRFHLAHGERHFHNYLFFFFLYKSLSIWLQRSLPVVFLFILTAVSSLFWTCYCTSIATTRTFSRSSASWYLRLVNCILSAAEWFPQSVSMVFIFFNWSSTRAIALPHTTETDRLSSSISSSALLTCTSPSFPR